MQKSNVVRLVTKVEKDREAVTEEFPGLKPSHDRFCSDCNDFVAIDCPSWRHAGHQLRELNPREQEAATVDVMWRYS